MTPKIELHLHLEGAAPPAFIRGLAREKSIDIGGIFDASGYYRYRDFWDFLKVYEAATSTLTTPEDYARLTLAVLEESAASGVVYSETFLSPDFCDWIVGFGIAGDEKIAQPKDFRWSFDCAREAGLRLTAHAGEWGGPESVRAAIQDLEVERIGHGVRAIEDLALVDQLAERGIVLECCPGSNVALGIYPSFAKHPISQLYERGVKVTVSTDDPPFFHTTMAREFEMLHRAFDWDDGVFAKLNQTALDAAFCDTDTKTRIAKLLEA